MKQGWYCCTISRVQSSQRAADADGTGAIGHDETVDWLCIRLFAHDALLLLQLRRRRYGARASGCAGGCRDGSVRGCEQRQARERGAEYGDGIAMASKHHGISGIWGRPDHRCGERTQGLRLGRAIGRTMRTAGSETACGVQRLRRSREIISACSTLLACNNGLPH